MSSTKRAAVAAYKDLVQGRGADVLRLAYGDAEALALAEELLADGSTLRHRDLLAVRAPALRAALDAQKPTDMTDTVALTRYVDTIKGAITLFWDSFEGEVVEGVEIIRRRT